MKNKFIGFRIEEGLKKEFEKTCQSMAINSSKQLVILIKRFVSKNRKK